VKADALQLGQRASGTRNQNGAIHGAAPHQRRCRIILAGERPRWVLIIRGIGTPRSLLDNRRIGLEQLACQFGELIRHGLEIATAGCLRARRFFIESSCIAPGGVNAASTAAAAGLTVVDARPVALVATVNANVLNMPPSSGDNCHSRDLLSAAFKQMSSGSVRGD